MAPAAGNGAIPPDRPLDADLCDELIVRFRTRLERQQREAEEIRQEFDRLHDRWLAHVENRNGGGE